MASTENLTHEVTKLYTVGEYAVAFAGHYNAGMAFVEWLKHGGGGKCPLGKHAHALVMSLETGTATVWEGKQPHIHKIENDCMALGSGDQLAIGAMEAGASVKKAIEIATRRDVYTGNGVDIIRAKRKPK